MSKKKQIGLIVIAALFCAILFSGCDDSSESSDGNGNDTGSAGLDSETGQGTDSSDSCAEATTIEACISTEGCLAIGGMKADLEQSCYGPEEILIACVKSERLCEDAEGHALDPETNECYRFPNLCMPDGWTVVSSDNENCVQSGDVCSD
jgi:hypothetical protein